MKQAVRSVLTKGTKLLVMKRNKFGQQYYTLLGGGVKIGEDPEQALRRQLWDEASIQVGGMRPIFIEEAGEPYGTQYVYWVEYQTGDPSLHPDSEEAKISALGQNTYQPVWVEIADLPTLPFRSDSLKVALSEAFKNGFPTVPRRLLWRPETHHERPQTNLEGGQ